MSWKHVLGLGVFIIIAAVVICAVPLITIPYTVTVPYQATETYYETEPYTYSVAETRILFDEETYAVSAGQGRAFPVHIEITDKSHNSVTGSVKAIAGGEFLFYIFDQKNYNAYRTGGSWQAYVYRGRVTDYRFSFVPDHSDWYYFVLSNTFSIFTNKLVEMSATWSWTEIRQGYREVEKQRTVTREREETRYRTVTLLDYLLNY